MLPKNIRWPNGAKIALNFSVNFEEGGQALLSEGDDHEETWSDFPSGSPPTVPDLNNREVYEYGMRVGFWRLIDLFERYDVKATFLIVGRALERHPETAKVMIDKGHEPAGHGYTWRPQWNMKEDEEREFIRKCVRVVTRMTGRRPYGWLNGGGSPSENTFRLLSEEGFLYSMNGFADDVPYYVDVGRGKNLLKVPYKVPTGDMRMWTAIGPRIPQDYLSFLKDTFDYLYAEAARQNGGGVMSVNLHQRVIGHAGRMHALESFVKYAKGHDDVWTAPWIDIAKWWLENYPPGLLTS